MPGPCLADAAPGLMFAELCGHASPSLCAGVANRETGCCVGRREHKLHRPSSEARTIQRTSSEQQRSQSGRGRKVTSAAGHGDAVSRTAAPTESAASLASLITAGILHFPAVVNSPRRSEYSITARLKRLEAAASRQKRLPPRAMTCRRFRHVRPSCRISVFFRHDYRRAQITTMPARMSTAAMPMARLIAWMPRKHLDTFPLPNAEHLPRQRWIQTCQETASFYSAQVEPSIFECACNTSRRARPKHLRERALYCWRSGCAWPS